MRIRTIVQLVAVTLLVGLVSAVPANGAGEPGVVHFTVAGDYGSTAATTAVLNRIAAQAPDLNLAVGDLSYGTTGAEQAWCDLVTSRVGAGFPFELISGNHESNGQNGNINDFSACLPNQLSGVVGTYGRQWYVDVPKQAPLVRFVMISPALPFTDGTWSYAAGTPRYTWTAAAIDGARAASIPWVVVGMHKPCLSVGTYQCDVGADLMNLLVSKKVDLVLTGHEHGYERTKQLGLTAGCAAVQPGSVTTACIRDSDNDLVKDQGTVFATVGTGGVGLYNMNPADSEAGYFAAWSGANSNPTYGPLDVQVTADQLDARFLPSSGGTFADAFTIRRGLPPANQPPVAAFTSSSTGLTASFDASGSSDDGTVASYAWNFGDGSTGTGVRPTHGYVAAGSYPVTLTVADDQGATGTVSHTVTVTSTPPPPAPFVSDSFNRTVSNGLGTADVGGAWTLVGTASNFAVAPGAAALTLRTAGTQLSAYLGATTRTDTDLNLTLATDKVADGGGLYLSVVGRRISLNNEYFARVRVYSTGSVRISLAALNGTSTATTIQPEIALPGITYTPGLQLTVRLQVTGTGPTTLRLKVWPASGSEPAAWQMSATDTTATLQAPGATGLTAYLSSSATNAPVVLRMSALTARPTTAG
jgi:PKD repeat protein